MITIVTYFPSQVVIFIFRGRNSGQNAAGKRDDAYFSRSPDGGGACVTAIENSSLQLVAARERMLDEGIDAASAAFEVGYESASQFNREYKRFFGQPPMRDVKVRRLAGSAMVSD
jgi:hypothetical protein